MLSAKGGFTLATLGGNFAWRHNFWVARSCSATTQWPLRQKTLDLLITLVNLARQVTFSQKGLWQVCRVWRVTLNVIF
jgi:hypothetical protein